MQIAPQAHLFKYLVPSWWDCVERIRRCDLIGDGAFWEPPLKLHKTFTIPRVLALGFFLVVSGCELSATASAPGLARCHALHHGGHGL